MGNDQLRDTDTWIYIALGVLDKRVINAEEIHIQPSEFFGSFSKAGIKILKLHDAVTSALNNVLQDRMSRLTRKKVYIEFFALLTVLVTVYLFAGNYFSVMDSLTSLADASKRIGSGDLNAVVSLKTEDETKLLADSFNDMARRLAEVVEELKRSNTDLEHFAYLASHDLKSPLLAVGSNLQLFQKRYKNRLDEEADRFISDAIKSTIRMEKLISALLAYSRLRTQGKPFEPTDSTEALNISIANLKVEIEDSGMEITHDALPKVIADPIQLVQLFQNLIGNAVKFRGQVKPQIHVSAEQKGRDWVFPSGTTASVFQRNTLKKSLRYLIAPTEKNTQAPASAWQSARRSSSATADASGWNPGRARGQHSSSLSRSGKKSRMCVFGGQYIDKF